MRFAIVYEGQVHIRCGTLEALQSKYVGHTIYPVVKKTKLSQQKIEKKRVTIIKEEREPTPIPELEVVEEESDQLYDLVYYDIAKKQCSIVYTVTEEEWQHMQDIDKRDNAFVKMCRKVESPSKGADVRFTSINASRRYLIDGVTIIDKIMYPESSICVFEDSENYALVSINGDRGLLLDTYTEKPEIKYVDGCKIVQCPQYITEPIIYDPIQERIALCPPDIYHRMTHLDWQTKARLGVITLEDRRDDPHVFIKDYDYYKDYNVAISRNTAKKNCFIKSLEMGGLVVHKITKKVEKNGKVRMSRKNPPIKTVRDCIEYALKSYGGITLTFEGNVYKNSICIGINNDCMIHMSKVEKGFHAEYCILSFKPKIVKRWKSSWIKPYLDVAVNGVTISPYELIIDNKAWTKWQVLPSWRPLGTCAEQLKNHPQYDSWFSKYEMFDYTQHMPVQIEECKEEALTKNEFLNKLFQYTNVHTKAGIIDALENETIVCFTEDHLISYLPIATYLAEGINVHKMAITNGFDLLLAKRINKDIQIYMDEELVAHDKMKELIMRF